MTSATRALLPGFEERFADLAGVLLRYFVAGEGEPLVLVHGLGGGASNWVELAPALARRRRVLVPDLPGHGGSAPLPAAPNVAAYADRAALLIEREAMLPAAVVGHSFGGLVGLLLAVRRPETVSALVLAAAAGISTRRPFTRFAIRFVGRTRPGRLVLPLRGVIARVPWLRYPVFGWWGVADPPALSARAVEGFLAPQALHTDVASAGSALLAEEPGAELGGVRCPCLVLWGARDAMVPLRDGFEYARRLGAPLRVIADCGHLLIGERPAECLDAIEIFLDRVRQVDELPLEPEPLG